MLIIMRSPRDMKRTPFSSSRVSPLMYTCTGCLIGILSTVSLLYIFHKAPTMTASTILPKPIPPIKSRGEIPWLLQEEGMRTGVEIGVDQGDFSDWILRIWTSCERYTAIDLWQHQVGSYLQHLENSNDCSSLLDSCMTNSFYSVFLLGKLCR